MIRIHAKDLREDIPVVLSLEDKTMSRAFPPHWIILEEPVRDIHSLMYYAKLVISSGDSMAREGAMLGVPSIYCGERIMKANELLIKQGMLHHLPGKEMISAANQIMAGPFDAQAQNKIREKLFAKWDDMVFFMKQQIDKYKRKT
jgi:predicted glycosyltransferase